VRSCNPRLGRFDSGAAPCPAAVRCRHLAAPSHAPRQIAGFELTPFAHGSLVHDVYVRGSGPAVVLIHEIPGIHPGVITLAEHLVGEGFSVYMPSLFGRPAGPASTPAIVRTILRVCVSREFTILADRTSRVVTWLRALAAKAHQDRGGPGVGAIGMCLTGGFALAMAVEPSVLAPVLSQPALPAPLGPRKRAALGLDPQDLTRIQERAHPDLRVLGLRFSNDRSCPGARFATLRDALAERFEAIEIDSTPGNPYGIPQSAHSVLTIDLVEQDGHPTLLARDRVIAFLAEQLKPPQAPDTRTFV
jgi:dienelactone hydrolase